MSKSTVTVFVKPHVAQILRSKYCLHHNIIDLPRSSRIRATLQSCLTKNFTESDHTKYITRGFVPVEFFLNDELIQQHGNTIGKAHYAHLNAVLEERFRDEAFYLINTLKYSRGMKLKDAMLQYLDLYNLHELFNYEALKVSYHRMRADAEIIFHKKKTVTA